MEDIWKALISDMWNFHLAIMGIMVSIITLLYASLCGKVEELKSIKKSEEYFLMNRATAISNSIERLRKLNKQAMVGLVVFFCLFVLTTILKYLPQGCITKWIVVINAIITIVFLFLGAKTALGIYSQYQKETF